MRCDEIGERLVELLYDEPGTPSASPELQAHIQTCPSCRQQLQELKEVRGALRTWKDEPPLRPVLIPRPASTAARVVRFPAWKVVRYAAIAAMLLMAFLAVANSEFTWSREGVSFKTHLFSPAPSADVPTKADMLQLRADMREVIKLALDDTETRMSETTNLKIQRLLETVENEQGYYTRLVMSRQNRNKN